MSITKYREEYLPKSGWEYPQFMQRYDDFFKSIWRVEEVGMEKDVRDWASATDAERAVISGILSGFTLLETHIQQYWAQVIPAMFPKPEICNLAMAYAYAETIHAQAYNQLSATLGIADHANFLADESARAKLDFFIDRKNVSDKVSLGVFSGVGEGTSLFSSFCTLLHFSRSGRFGGLRQILSWSVTDETAHSDTGCELFQLLTAEEGISEDELAQIYAAFDTALTNEDAYLDNVFKLGSLDGLDKEDVKAYLRYRANDRLQALGLNPCYTYDRKASERIAEWFHPMTKGLNTNDAFSSQKNGDAYVSKVNLDWQNVDLTALRDIDY